jgi:hypothetical protein
VSDGSDFRMIEDRTVKLRRLFGLIVEPEAGRQFLHALHDDAPLRVIHAGLSA